MSTTAETMTGAEAGQQRVVCIAMDGSDQSKYAYQYYLKEIRKDGDKLYLIHSAETNSILHTTQWDSSPFGVDKDKVEKLMDEEKQKTDQKMKQFAELLKEDGIEGVVKGVHAESAGEAICKAVTEVDASVVVMGSRGLGKIRRTFVGSVSDYVVHHCKVPVLVCRNQTN